jgi:exonuclease III
MIGFIWNSNGFGDPAKHLTIIEAIRENCLDFVVISETGRSNFAAPFLNHVAAGYDFVWFCLPPHGRSGGILAGFNTATLNVSNILSGDFCVKFHLKNKEDGFEWALVAVYGAAQDANKPHFLAELVRICESKTRPMLVGGDFNIIRRQEEKK